MAVLVGLFYNTILLRVPVANYHEKVIDHYENPRCTNPHFGLNISNIHFAGMWARWTPSPIEWALALWVHQPVEMS